MKTAVIQTSVPRQSEADSSKRPSVKERIRLLNEATLSALRKAGQERARKEQEAKQVPVAASH